MIHALIELIGAVSVAFFLHYLMSRQVPANPIDPYDPQVTYALEHEELPHLVGDGLHPADQCKTCRRQDDGEDEREERRSRARRGRPSTPLGPGAGTPPALVRLRWSDQDRLEWERYQRVMREREGNLSPAPPVSEHPRRAPRGDGGVGRRRD